MQPTQIIITGASRGLGRLIALEFARAGASLVLAARDGGLLGQVSAACTAAGAAEVQTLVDDVTSPAMTDALLRAVVPGAPFALINNAAIQGPIGNSWEASPEAFEETIRVDFLAPVMLSHAAIPAMAAAGGGWIVNISGGGATGPRPGFAAYGAAKTALVRFSETLAAEAGPLGVRVNAVAPGAFRSGMTQAVLAAADAAGAKEATVAQKLVAGDDDAAARKAAALAAYLVLGAGRDITGRLISAVWDPWETLHTHAGDLDGGDIYTLRRITPPERGKDWGG